MKKKTDDTPLPWWKRHRGLLILLGASLLARLYYLSHLGPLPPYETWPKNYLSFLWALENHFWPYVFHFAFKPPLFLFVWKGLLLVFGSGEFLYDHRIFLWLAFVADLGGLALAYDLFRRLRVRVWISTGVLLAASLYLIPLEVWKDGFHYDQLSFFFTLLFFHAIVLLLEKNSKGRLLYASLSGFVVTFFSPVLPFVGLAGLFSALVLFPREGWGEFRRKEFWIGVVKTGLICAAGFLLAVGMMKAKNARLGIGSVTSNAGGLNIMHVVHQSLGFNSPRVNKVVWDAEAPDWYKWCWKNANNEIFQTVTQGPWMSQSRGICFPRMEDAALSEGPTWPYDFTALKGFLDEGNFPEVQSAVEADIQDMTERPYLFSGPAPELGPRFIGLYGSESVKIARYALFKYPGLMWEGFLKRHQIFFKFGAISPLKLSGLMNKRIFLNKPLYHLSQMFKGLYVLFLVSLAFGVGLAGVVLFSKGKMSWDYGWWRSFFLFALPFAAFIVMYSGLSYTENERYFVLGVPFLAILTGLLFEKFTLLIRK